jgi:23S rRNA (guanosine2251-2'-O)-methyltransferase
LEKSHISKEKTSLGRAITGRRNAEEFLGSGNLGGISEIWIKDSLGNSAFPELTEINSLRGKIKRKPGKELDLRYPNNQGIIIWVREDKSSFRTKNFSDFKSEVEPNLGPILILDRIQDPGNLGAILRTAECLGVKLIILPERDTCGINETVSKVSSGALHFLEIYQVPNLSRCLEVLKEKDYWIVSSSDQGDSNWEDLPDPSQLVLIVGNEGSGVKNLLLTESDFTVAIPMLGNISSLNVSVATGIILDRIQNRNL